MIPQENATGHSMSDEDLDIDAFFLPGGILDPDAGGGGATTATTTTMTVEVVDPSLSSSTAEIHYATAAGVVATTTTTTTSVTNRSVATPDLACLLPPRSPSPHHRHHSSQLPLNPWEETPPPSSSAACAAVVVVPRTGTPPLSSSTSRLGIPNIHMTIVASDQQQEEDVLLLNNNNNTSTILPRVDPDPRALLELPKDTTITTRPAALTATPIHDDSNPLSPSPSWLLSTHHPTMSTAGDELLPELHGHSIAVTTTTTNSTTAARTRRVPDDAGSSSSAGFLQMPPPQRDTSATTTTINNSSSSSSSSNDNPIGGSAWLAVSSSPDELLLSSPAVALPSQPPPKSPASASSRRVSLPLFPPPPPGFETAAVTTTLLGDNDAVCRSSGDGVSDAVPDHPVGGGGAITMIAVARHNVGSSTGVTTIENVRSGETAAVLGEKTTSTTTTSNEPTQSLFESCSIERQGRRKPPRSPVRVAKKKAAGREKATSQEPTVAQEQQPGISSKSHDLFPSNPETTTPVVTTAVATATTTTALGSSIPPTSALSSSLSGTMTTSSCGSSISSKLSSKRKKKNKSTSLQLRDKSPEEHRDEPDGATTTTVTTTVTGTLRATGAEQPLAESVSTIITAPTTILMNGHVSETQPIAVPEEESLGQSMAQILTSFRSFLDPLMRSTVGAVVLVVKYIAIFFMAMGTVGEYALEEGALGTTRLWHEVLSSLRQHPHHYYEPRQTSEYVLCSIVLYLFPFLCDVLMNYTDCPHYTPHILSNASLYALSLRLSRLSLADYTSTVPTKRGKPVIINHPNKSSCVSSSATRSSSTNSLSEADRRQLEYELGHRILRSLRYAIPCNFVLEGFSAANASFALADPPMRLVLAYSLSLVRHGLVLSPVAWMGWSAQILLATHLPARGLQLDFILMIVGLAFLRLVGTLHCERARM